jgi:predicted MFS family arabinose efflux permease
MWGIPVLLFFIGFFHRAAPGVITRDLMESFGLSAADVGALSAAYFYTYAALMVPAGLLIDAYGPRYVLAVGGTVMGLGALAMGLATSLPVLFAGRLIVGLGATVTFVGTLKIAAAWFPPSRFATLSALTATVGVLAAIVATYPLAALVSLAGWRAAFDLVGLVTLAGAVLCLTVVRDHPPGGQLSAAPAVGARAVMRGAAQVLRNPRTWPPFLAFFCYYSALGNLMLWVVPFLQDVYGLSTPRAAAYATATGIALVISAPVTGYLSDAVLHRRKAPYAILSAALFFVWAAFALTLGAVSLAGVYVLLFAIGACAGSFVLTWPIGREVNPPHLAGVAVAVVNFGGFLGAAVTQGPLGAVLDARWTGAMVAGARVYPVSAYQTAFGICAVFLLGSMLLSLLVQETRGENVYEHRRAARPGWWRRERAREAPEP